MFFVAMGFELVGLVLVFLYIGEHIDSTYKMRGMGVAGCLLLALVCWFVHIFIHLRRLDEDPK